MRVLLVLNRKTIIRKFKEAFKDSEYQLTVCETTEGAFRKTLKYGFGLIICGPMLRDTLPNFTFATDMHFVGKKVLIVDRARGLPFIPFLNNQGLNRERILEAVTKILQRP